MVEEIIMNILSVIPAPEPESIQTKIWIPGQARDDKKNRGFTLMELLIVIALIGILISISVAAYTTAQKRTRDSRRQGDLKAIQNALEQYNSATSGAYPGGTYPNLTQLSATYLPNGEPKDPKISCSYNAVTWTATAYKVCADLEGVGAFLCTSACSCTPEQDFCVTNLQ